MLQYRKWEILRVEKTMVKGFISELQKFFPNLATCKETWVRLEIKFCDKT